MAELAQLSLDTARLGLMSSSASLAAGDFARLTGEEAFTLYGDRFLTDGVRAFPHFDSRDYPGLTAWSGIMGLKRQLRAVAGTIEDTPVLLANRSTVLMQLAARRLVQSCKAILLADTGWPAYREIVEEESRRRGTRLVVADIRQQILDGSSGAEETIGELAANAVRNCCDGLFLAAVSNDGIRLPIKRIVKAIEQRRPQSLVVIDGAQDFCHTPADGTLNLCDVYIAGCHKWLRAYQPLGVAFLGRDRSRPRINSACRSLQRANEHCDPLLRFTTQLENDDLDGTSETVNLAPLFSCHGALQDILNCPVQRDAEFEQRLRNAAEVSELAAANGWRPLMPELPFRSGILMLQATRARTRAKDQTELRRQFANRRVSLTSYADGLIRLSMPGRPWQAGELDFLGQVLRAVA